ncbi:hypothetical protein NE694_21780 [Phocaeicola vulgatus]|nr:hypothetical protein [Phocaeicola vulgatus]
MKRTISNDCLKVFNLVDEKVILTVSFTPLETRNQQYHRYG